MTARSQPEPVADPPVYVITPAEFRMRCVAGWIEQYRKTLGYAPSVREIGAYVGTSSSRSAMDLLVEMSERGFVWWEDGKSRTTVTAEGPPLGTVERLRDAPSLLDWIETRRLGAIGYAEQVRR
jgi:SOS-response transcriptional repressor LexA